MLHDAVLNHIAVPGQVSRILLDSRHAARALNIEAGVFSADEDEEEEEQEEQANSDTARAQPRHDGAAASQQRPSSQVGSRPQARRVTVSVGKSSGDKEDADYEPSESEDDITSPEKKKQKGNAKKSSSRPAAIKAENAPHDLLNEIAALGEFSSSMPFTLPLPPQVYGIRS